MSEPRALMMLAYQSALDYALGEEIGQLIVILDSLDNKALNDLLEAAQLIDTEIQGELERRSQIQVHPVPAHGLQESVPP